jgi:signal transduction histidine kinase
MPNGGRIEIEASVDERRLILAVSDDGPGVPPQHRPRLFDPFFTTREDGLGLGLAIVRKHLEEVGGEVVYDPPRGGGARFVVKIPLGRKEA